MNLIANFLPAVMLVAALASPADAVPQRKSHRRTSAADRAAVKTRSATTQAMVVGKWVAVNRSGGGIGSVWNFKPDGSLTMSPAAILDNPYKLEGDKLTLPPATKEPDAKPQVARVRIVGDTLYQRPIADGDAASGRADSGEGGDIEQKLIRLQPATPGESAIVGAWRPVTMPAGGGDRNAAMRAAYEHATYTYTRKGILKLRIPFKVFAGTYDATAGTFKLKGRPSSDPVFHFRVKGDKLFLVQPDRHTKDVYVRDDTD